MNTTINLFAQSIIDTTLSIDDIIKLANDYGGRLIDGAGELRIVVGEDMAVYVMNSYLWKRHRIVRYTFTETRLA